MVVVDAVYHRSGGGCDPFLHIHELRSVLPINDKAVQSTTTLTGNLWLFRGASTSRGGEHSGAAAARDEQWSDMSGGEYSMGNGNGETKQNYGTWMAYGYFPRYWSIKVGRLNAAGDWSVFRQMLRMFRRL